MILLKPTTFTGHYQLEVSAVAAAAAVARRQTVWARVLSQIIRSCWT